MGGQNDIENFKKEVYEIENLDKWKNTKNRKPLIIEGARQVGKTWIMKEFGKKSYNKTVYINFDSNVQMAELFSIDLNVERIIMWLSDCGLVHKVSRINAPNIPLNAYEESKAFKLFIVDVGLLGAMVGLNQRTLLNGNELFTEFKGALTEQYVMQQLAVNQDLGIYYYTNDRNTCEVDFIVDNGDNITPLEVKAEINLKAKSLKTYREKFTPEISIRSSMADYSEEVGLINIPLYAIEGM